MSNFITVYNQEGNIEEVEVIDIFNVEGYDHEYILYTKNKEIDENNVEVYVSILEQNEDEFKLLNIEDETEWETVQKALDEMGD